MAPNAEGIVVVVQHADALIVQHHHVLNGHEGEREVLSSDPYVTGRARLGNAVAILNFQQVHRQPFAYVFSFAVQLDFVDRLEAIKISLATVSLDDQSPLRAEQDKIADGGTTRVQRILISSTGVFFSRQIKGGDQQPFVFSTQQGFFQQRQQPVLPGVVGHAFKSTAALGQARVGKLRGTVRPVEAGQPGGVFAVEVLQVRSVARVVDLREVAEQANGTNLRILLVHYQQRAEVEALDVGAVRQVGTDDYVRYGLCEGLRRNGPIGEHLAPAVGIGTRVYFRFNVEAYARGVLPATLGLRFATPRPALVVGHVVVHKIKQLL